MEALRKQATKIREQVAKQQQAVLKQFGSGMYEGADNVVTDEAELQLHQKLEKLYISTSSAKHFQRDLVRGAQGYIVNGCKQVEIGTKLSEDSKKYGVGNTCTIGNTLSKAALAYGQVRSQMEEERGELLKNYGRQVVDPLRAMVTGTQLEDARRLAQRYIRIRQEAEAQDLEVSRYRDKVKEFKASADNTLKLEAAEAKLDQLQSNMAVLGKEAAAAMAAVEAQQQRLTLKQMIAMIEAECVYHRKSLEMLDQLKGKIVPEREPAPDNFMSPPPSYEEEVNGVDAFSSLNGTTESIDFFLGEVLHSYQAESDVELNLLSGDYVVIRKVSNNGWAEGECRGKAGWFPIGYVERRERVHASKIARVF